MAGGERKDGSAEPSLHTEGHFECRVCHQSGDASWVHRHRSVPGFHQIMYVHDRHVEED